MVQWKGEIDKEKSGGRAARLDSIDSLQVPNFFTVTREEVGELVGEDRDPEKILDKEFPESLYSEVKDAFSDINVSSEVRNASGRARNLVEGQRNGGKVSIRISGDRKGVYNYRINVGASGLEEAIKEVVASYYSVEGEEKYPAVIIQRMVEPEISGAAIISYLGQYGLVEAVKGLGTSLEQGITTPDRYLLENGSVVGSEFPDEQVKTTINPMSGSQKKKTEKRRKALLRESEVSKIYGKASQADLNVKFAYKRGSFYVIDAFESKNGNPFGSTEASLEGVRVSEGEIEGQIGRNIRFSDETLSPDQYSDALIARKGGYTSTHAQLARGKSKPAIFSFQGEVRERQKVEIGKREVEIDVSEEAQISEGRQDRADGTSTISDTSIDSVVATEVIPLNSGPGLYLSPPFRGRYAVTDQGNVPGQIPTQSYLKSYADIFRFEGKTALIDARRLEKEGLKNAMEYLEADTKLIIFDGLDREIIKTAIAEGFDGISTGQEHLEQVKSTVAREEKKFILNKLREK